MIIELFPRGYRIRRWRLDAGEDYDAFMRRVLDHPWSGDDSVLPERLELTSEAFGRWLTCYYQGWRIDHVQLPLAKNAFMEKARMAPQFTAVSIPSRPALRWTFSTDTESAPKAAVRTCRNCEHWQGDRRSPGVSGRCLDPDSLQVGRGSATRVWSGVDWTCGHWSAIVEDRLDSLRVVRLLAMAKAARPIASGNWSKHQWRAFMEAVHATGDTPSKESA